MMHDDHPMKQLTHEALDKLGFDPSSSPVQRKDFRNADSKASWFLKLDGLCLIGADFTGLDLKFAEFKNCDLSSARFNGCNLFKARFTECILYNATFDGAVLVDVKFCGSKLFGIRFQNAEIFGKLYSSGISELLTRELYDNDKSVLAYRGTAGRREWLDLIRSFKCTPFGRDRKQFGGHIVESEAGTMLIPSPTGNEVIERCPLYSQILQRRWDNQDIDDSESGFPHPPGDAWAEDSTAMMLRGYRECLDRHGRSNPSSEARFWEKSYLAASNWRIIQSKIFGADEDGNCSSVRWLVGLAPALIAWSLLHPQDDRRKCAIAGRELQPKGLSRVKRILHWLRMHVPNKILAPMMFPLQLCLTLFLVSSALIGFWWGFWWGVSWALLIPSLIVFALCCVAEGLPWSSKRGWNKFVQDFCSALSESVAQVLSGNGEKPWRAISAMGVWVILFGVMYSIIPVDSNFWHNSDLEIGYRLGFDYAMYYSFINATTLGLGDITPVSKVMQRAASIEVMGALLITAVFLASLMRKFIGR